MKKVTLYTKLRCHLCEEAYRELMSVACDISLTIDVVDITHDHNRAIQSRYATRIPVLTCPGAPTELDWPFSAEDVRAYLFNV
jgi:glutaredoxin